MSRIALLILILFGFSQHALSQDRTLIAEGDYSAEKKDGPTTLAHWKLWHMGNGEYDVIESSAKNPHLAQTFRFDGQFLPIGYSIDIGPLSAAEISQHPDAASLFQPMSISCEYKVQELKCLTDYDGHKSVASIDAQYPYVFFPGEFYAMDFTWFLTGIVHLLEQGGVQGGPVNTYVMEDSPTNWRLGEIVLKADQPMRLYFTGHGTSTVMGKAQRTRNYEGWGGPSELSVLRVTSQGVVVLISGKSTPDVGPGITNFVEHEPWPLPFRPVLESTQLPAPLPNATQAASTSGTVPRVRVPSGVMQGLIVHKVQPVYPESAKQKHIEGEVVLSAITGTNGHILELKALSGTGELVPAAIDAVQQWEYKPYAPSGQATEVETEIQVKFTLSH